MNKLWRDLPAFAVDVPSSANDPLAIAEFRSWSIREPDSKRHYTVVKLTTKNGVSGYGEGAGATHSEILEAKSVVLGRAAFEGEFIRHRLDAIPAMEAALSNAMLDLSAKSAGVPVYQYLGGPTRYEARVLAHIDARNDDEYLSSLNRARQNGYKAFTFPIPLRDTMSRIQEHIDLIRQRVNSLRSAAGDDIDFVLEAGGSLSPGDAAAIATALEKVHLLWFDEPISVLTNDALSKITDESVMPVGLGRNVHDLATYQNLLRWGCIDILRPSTGLNSARKIRRMAAIAETHYVAVAPHHDGGPVGTVAAIHLAASLPNFFIQQVPQPSSERDRKMRADLTSGDYETAQNGFAPLINKPGLGIEVNEAALKEYSEETL